MASAFPFDDDLPFEEKVKNMADEELLEVWAESQQIEQMLRATLPANVTIAPDYERAIVAELFLRASRKPGLMGSARA